jgi:ferredoxin-nitrite reductase
MNLLEGTLNLRNKKINKIEKLKSKRTPADFFNHFEEICKGRYEEQIGETETKHLLKCFGIYDKGSSDNFTIRLRIPGGQLDIIQAKKLALISKKYGKDYIDITTRAQIELRFLNFKDLPIILKELNEVGITTLQTAGDNFRGVVTSPLDGYSKTSKIETMPLLKQIQSVFLNNEKYLGTLPRKFNISILADEINDCNVFGNDCGFALAKKGNGFGFNLYLGGKVGIQAKDLNLFIKPEDIKIVFTTIVDIFKEYGFKDNRNKNRLIFLIEAIGTEEFKNIIKLKSGLELEDAGELQVKKEFSLENDSTVKLKDDFVAVHFAIPSGIFSGSDLEKIANLAQLTDSKIRLTYEQSFYLITKDKNIDLVKQSSIYNKFSTYQNIYFANQIACAGRKTCSFATIDNKSDAINMAKYLNNEVALEYGKIRMYWSACTKGCGIHGVADIGFEGTKAKDENGNFCDSVKIFIGGKASTSILEARQLYKATPIKKAQLITKELVNIYKNERLEKESFESFDSRVLSKLTIEQIQEKIGY